LDETHNAQPTFQCHLKSSAYWEFCRKKCLQIFTWSCLQRNGIKCKSH